MTVDEALEIWDNADNALRTEFLQRVHYVNGCFRVDWCGYDMVGAIRQYFECKGQNGKNDMEAGV